MKSKFILSLFLLNLSLLFSSTAICQDVNMTTEIRQGITSTEIRMPGIKYPIDKMISELNRREANNVFEIVFQITNNGVKDTITLVPMNTAAKPNTPTVRYETGRLLKLLASAKNNGDNYIKFQVAKIRAEDVDRYTQNHPELTDEDKAAIVGRPTLLIRLSPGSLGIAASSANGNSDGELFVEMGKICPPPTNCN